MCIRYSLARFYQGISSFVTKILVLRARHTFWQTLFRVLSAALNVVRRPVEFYLDFY